VFLGSVAITIHSCRSMAGAGMLMPGGWIMSMTWMRMPGQGWSGSAASFMGMWVVMMAAMMLPSLAPALLCFRLSLQGLDAVRLGWLTGLATAGYFFMWALLGAGVYPVGVLVAKAIMGSAILARSAPIVTGVVLLLAGCLQLTSWKTRQLCRCRPAPACERIAVLGAGGAWSHGLRLGADCTLCCSGLTAVLLVSGVMDLGAMALVAAAITAERILPQPQRVARASGVAIIVTGVFMGSHWVFRTLASS
jgi:predicted metal-binding membrane protein